jgi:hypothetical protein
MRVGVKMIGSSPCRLPGMMTAIASAARWLSTIWLNAERTSTDT